MAKLCTLPDKGIHVEENESIIIIIVDVRSSAKVCTTNNSRKKNDAAVDSSHYVSCQVIHTKSTITGVAGGWGGGGIAADWGAYVAIQLKRRTEQGTPPVQATARQRKSERKTKAEVASRSLLDWLWLWRWVWGPPWLWFWFWLWLFLGE